MADKAERRIALFLDFENLVTNTGITSANFDAHLQPALDQLLEKGKVVFRRAYCDWSRFREAKAGLHALGVELIDVPPSTAAGKNAADMRLVIDALELSYLREHIDTFVIASGDSDFCPLTYKLRENGRTVIGLGVRGSTSPLFVRACDEFIYLKPGGGSAKAGADEERERGRRDGGGKKQRDTGGRSEKHKGSGRAEKAKVPDFVREAVQSLLGRAAGPLNPSAIKETLVRKKPDFDVREAGFSTFSRLLEALEKEGVLKLQQLKGRQVYVLPPDFTPESSDAAGADEEEAIPDPTDDA